MSRSIYEKPMICAGFCIVALFGCAQPPSTIPRTNTVAGKGAGSSGQEQVSVERVDVGGRALFIACEGAGHPTVMMETGFSDAGIVWGRALIRRVAEISRVCV